MLVTGDLRLAMARLEGGRSAPGDVDYLQDVAQETLALGPWIARIVRIPRGHRFEHPVKVATVALLLSGLGTLIVDDWRATVLAGQVTSLSEGQRVALVADGDEAVVVVLWHLELALGSEPEPAVALGEAKAEHEAGGVADAPDEKSG